MRADHNSGEQQPYKTRKPDAMTESGNPTMMIIASANFTRAESAMACCRMNSRTPILSPRYESGPFRKEDLCSPRARARTIEYAMQKRYFGLPSHEYCQATDSC